MEEGHTHVSLGILYDNVDINYLYNSFTKIIKIELIIEEHCVFSSKSCCTFMSTFMTFH